MQTYRDGVRLLKARSAGGPSWRQMADIHGDERGFNRCPHGNWYFLSWHRAYVLMYERMIRAVTNNADFAMPYWDWNSQRRIPQAFTERRYRGADNPLYEPNRQAGLRLDDSIVGDDVIDRIMSQTNFEAFGTSRPTNGGTPQNSLDPAWIGRPGTKGELEFGPHDNVHGLVGGANGVMGDARSARDPLFMMHHCNIDRIWWAWNCRGNRNTTDPLWLNMPYTDHFLDNAGAAFTMRAADLLNTNTLGYTYGFCLSEILDWLLPSSLRLASIFEAGPAAAAQSTGAIVLQTQAGALAQAGARTFAAAGARQALTNVGAREVKLMAPQAVAAADATRALAKIDNLTPTSNQQAVRVFVNLPNATAETPTTDPHFVTTIGFFGAPSHAGGGHEARPVSVLVDLTQTLQRLGAEGVGGDQIAISLVPIQRGPTAAPSPAPAVATTIQQADVDVAIV